MQNTYRGSDAYVVNAINDAFKETGVTANFVTGSMTEITLINEQGENIQITDITGFDAELISASGTVTNLLEGGVDSALISGQVSLFSESAIGFSVNSTSADIFAAAITDSKLASINTVDASTQSGAQDALGVIDHALDQLGGFLADLGSFQNNNDYRLDQLSTGFQNNTAALGRKVDADFTLEVTEQINQQMKFQVNAAVFGVSGNAAKNFIDLLNN
ncbi:A-type flagellin [Piscirickettsiaceae bacterium NZ-RLO1]|nr:A-type flagellin [Piscirickettsiaceae bacterium NZ-RLO1]